MSSSRKRAGPSQETTDPKRVQIIPKHLVGNVVTWKEPNADRWRYDVISVTVEDDKECHFFYEDVTKVAIHPL